MIYTVDKGQDERLMNIKDRWLTECKKLRQTNIWLKVGRKRRQ
jgi:hypothetical protein